MKLDYILDFDIAAIFILVIVYIYLRVQYSKEQRSTMLFRNLMVGLFLLTVFDMISHFTHENAAVIPKFVNYITNSIFYGLEATIVFMFSRYLYATLQLKRRPTVARYALEYFPILFYFECIICNFRINLLFEYDDRGHCVYGAFYYLFYLIPLYYCLYSIVLIIRSKVPRKKVFGVVGFYIGCIAGAVIETVFYTDVMVICFSVSVGMLAMLITLETPDFEKLENESKKLEAANEHAAEMESTKDYVLTEKMYNVRSKVDDLSELCNQLQLATSEKSERSQANIMKAYSSILANTTENFNLVNRVDDDKLVITDNRYDLSRLISEVKKICEPVAKDRGHKLAFEFKYGDGLKNSEKPKLIGDKKKVKQLLLNFATFAIYDADEPEIDISIDFNTLDENLGRISMSAVYRVTGDKKLNEKTFDCYDKADCYNNMNLKKTLIELKVLKLLCTKLEGKVSAGCEEDGKSYVEAEILQAIG